MVFLFLSCAVVWLIVASLAGLTSSIKLHEPDWLTQQAWLSFGRLRTVHLNALAYGWAPMAALGIAIWLLPRLLKTKLVGGRFAILGGMIWTAGLIAGLGRIPGWGSDLDRKNWPAISMERAPPRFIHVPVGQPVQQAQTVEVFCSRERPGITPIFGTAQPPKWLSGAIRRLACKLPENDLRHWLMLIAADRVNMVEGIVDDLRHGHVPNVLGEMGIRSELRTNPAGLVRKALITTAVVGGIMALLNRPKRY